ncbi:unnamed protein product [Lupinus luteus]|uniref:RING-type E3 ubiquitin transferase n=1 Tax=Lupinus luteus TaxID=3873 RepID=A0AAV1YIV8_LUPLU
MMSGVTQHTGIENQHNLDMDIPAAANLNHSRMNPSSSTGVLHLPLNHTASGQLYGSSASAVSGAYKRKTAGRIRRNYQHFNASASSSVASPNARYSDGDGMMDIASFPMPQYRGNSIPPLVDIGADGSLWSGPGESNMVHDNNHLIRGNYLGQHFQPAPPPWLDRQLNSNINDGHAAAWNLSLPMPYIQAVDANGSSLEDASMGLQMHPDTARNRNGFRFPHPPPVIPQHHNFHHPTPPMQGMRGHSFRFRPTAVSFRVPTNPSRSAAIPRNDFEMGARLVETAPYAGLHRYRPHREAMPEATLGHQNLSPMPFFQVDDVALLVDHHRDMRLDIDDMSYEELLALGERIGNVSTGLSEEMITTQMKIKTYLVPATAINLELASEEQKTDSCTICLDEYQNREKIGILKCGHEYHADCLRKWLLVKNVCPICKSEGLTPGGKRV